MQCEQCLLVPCCPTCPPCYLCYRSKCVPGSLNQRQPCSSADTWQYLEMFLKVMGGGRSGCWHLAGILTWLHCTDSAPLTEVRTLKPTMPRLESPGLQLNEQIPVCTPASPFLLLNTDGRTQSLCFYQFGCHLPNPTGAMCEVTFSLLAVSCDTALELLSAITQAYGCQLQLQKHVDKPVDRGCNMAG